MQLFGKGSLFLLHSWIVFRECVKSLYYKIYVLICEVLYLGSNLNALMNVYQDFTKKVTLF